MPKSAMNSELITEMELGRLASDSFVRVPLIAVDDSYPTSVPAVTSKGVSVIGSSFAVWPAGAGGGGALVWAIT